ncbi:MAG: toxin-antitoxin system, antitoxin component, MazE family [Candidatus Campylobacter infans]|nr:MAG: toxin-antitoxin system, antitoxin component, MazE family [Candidatus Campylobacter infans]
MQVRLNKLGNSMVIRVPNLLIKQLNLKENTPLNLSIVKNKLIVEKSKDEMVILCEKITDENLNIYDDFSKVGKEW